MALSVWGTTVQKEGLCRKRKSAREGLWKRRKAEKSKNRLSRLAWKSRKRCGIPTFPQPRRLREINLNRTFHLLRKADILMCYQQFFSPYGIRSLSRYHLEHPFSFDWGGREY